VTASRCAERTVDPVTAEDVVSESFLKLYGITAAGGGPAAESVRPYLLQIIRNTAIDTLRGTKEIPIDTRDPATMTLFDKACPTDDDEGCTVLARDALTELPSRWKRVLFALEIEGRSRLQVAEMMGINVGAVSALALRARRGLRRTYVALHRDPCPLARCRALEDRGSGDAGDAGDAGSAGDAGDGPEA
jgi:RNA polymerase sigma factor (sigma-70 family)